MTRRSGIGQDFADAGYYPYTFSIEDRPLSMLLCFQFWSAVMEVDGNLVGGHIEGVNR